MKWKQVLFFFWQDNRMELEEYIMLIPFFPVNLLTVQANLSSCFALHGKVCLKSLLHNTNVPTYIQQIYDCSIISDMHAKCLNWFWFKKQILSHKIHSLLLRMIVVSLEAYYFIKVISLCLWFTGLCSWCTRCKKSSCPILLSCQIKILE